MKLYLEKWTTETIWTGRLTSIDTDVLRENFENLKDLSDEEIFEELIEDEYKYDINNLIEEIDALQAQNSSADKSSDYRIDIHKTDDIMDKIQWNAWHKGCLEFPREDDFEESKSKFIEMIPEAKSLDMI